MASTVNNAFADFLRDTVNLDADQTKTALSSRDWLIDQINALPGRDANFPTLAEWNHLNYGSFARRTKIRPLNDIDLMICLHAQGCVYDEYSDRIEITVNMSATQLTRLCHSDVIGYKLNSIRVINTFVKSLQLIPQYKKTEIKRNQQAAVLNLSTRDWSYDIVPCFITSPESDGRTYYLIPDGKGHWMKTDPRIDKVQATSVNQLHNGNVLNVLRLIKYWNTNRIASSFRMPSYLLETIVLDYYKSKTTVASSWPDVEIADVLDSIAGAINWPVNDPKGIQGNINKLDSDSCWRIADIAGRHAVFARQARHYETINNHKASINAWQQVFGPYFPYFD